MSNQPTSETTVALSILPTGPIPWRDQLLALAALRFTGRRVTGRYSLVLQPRRRIGQYLVDALGDSAVDLDTAPLFGEIEPDLREFLAGYPLVGLGIKTIAEFLAAELSRVNAPGIENSLIELADLAEDHGVAVKKPSLEHLAAALGLQYRAPGNPVATARVTAQIASRLIESSVSGVQPPPPRRANLLPDRWALLDPARVRGVAETPGVYIFRDCDGEILYAGAASNLRRRLTSYQSRPLQLERRLEGLPERVWDIETHPTEGFLEALLDEARFISEHAPPFNVQRRTSLPRRYLRAWTGDRPSLRPVAEVDADGAIYVGPFLSARRAEEALELVRELFPGLTSRAPMVPGETRYARQRRLTRERASAQLARADAVRQAVRFLSGQREPALAAIRERSARAARDGDHKQMERLRQTAKQAARFEVVASPLRDGPASRFAVICLDLEDVPRVVYQIAAGSIVERHSVDSPTQVDTLLQRWQCEQPTVQSNPGAFPLIMRWLALQGTRCSVVPLSAAVIGA